VPFRSACIAEKSVLSSILIILSDRKRGSAPETIAGKERTVSKNTLAAQIDPVIDFNFRYIRIILNIGF
jgi:hypothetical protein